MTPSKNLYYLKKASQKKIKRLEDKSRYAMTLSKLHREPIIAFVVIEALNTWNNFLRAFYLSFIIKTKTTKRKTIIVNPPVLSFNDAIGLAINHYRPTPILPPTSGIWERRKEPTWHDINNIINFSVALNCSYELDIRSAFSIGTSVYSDLPIIRNYFAHRNDSTAMKVKNIAPSYGISSSLNPTDIICTRPLSANQPLIINMLNDIYITIDFLCEGL